MTTSNMFDYARGPSEWGDQDISGYAIEATDGDIGKVDKRNDEAGAQCLVVKTGPWIMGEKVVLPAGVVQGIDHERQAVQVACTKEAIKNAPEYDESTWEDPTYREKLGSHYSTGGGLT